MLRILDTVEEDSERLKIDFSILSSAKASDVIDNFSSHRFRGVLKIIKVYDEEKINYPTSELVMFKKLVIQTLSFDSY